MRNARICFKPWVDKGFSDACIYVETVGSKTVVLDKSQVIILNRIRNIQN